MSKVSQLPELAAPDGTETVPAVSNGVLKRTQIGLLVSAALSPLVGPVAAQAAADAVAAAEIEIADDVTRAENAANSADQSKNTIDALSLGLAGFYNSRADADAAIGTHGATDVIEIYADESEGDQRTRRRWVDNGGTPEWELVGALETYKAPYIAGSHRRSIVARLASKIYFEDALTDAELESVHNGTATFDAAARLEAFVNETSGHSTAGTFSSGREIVLPHGKLKGLTECNICHAVGVHGEGRGENGGTAPTVWETAADVTAFVFNRHDTYSDTTSALAGKGGTNAAGFSMSDMLIRSDGGTDYHAHAIRWRVKGFFDRLNIYNFPGVGIYGFAAASTAYNSQLGNINYGSIDNCRITNCTGGIYFDGGDANAVRIGLVDLRSNRLFGILAGNLLGNNYVGPVHCAFNGNSEMAACFYNEAQFLFRGGSPGYFDMENPALNAVGGNSVPGSGLTIWQWDGAGGTGDGYVDFEHHVTGGIGAKVVYKDHRFTGLTADCARHIPFAEDPNWDFRGYQSQANVFFPAHDPGRTYYPGGAVVTIEANAPDVFSWLYVEGQQRTYFESKAFVRGIFSGTDPESPGIYWTGRGYQTKMEWDHPDGFGTLTWLDEDGFFAIRYVGDASQGWKLKCDLNNHNLVMQHGGSTTCFSLTTDRTTLTLGRASPVGGGFMVAQKLAIGRNDSNARIIDVATGPPTTGEAARGERVFNRNYTGAGSIYAWICTGSGTNGVDAVWLPIYARTTAE